MKKVLNLAFVGIIAIAFFAFTPAVNKLSTAKTHVKFFSTTVAEDIEAHNYKSVSTIDTKSGDVVFSLPMQSFEFKKSLMQKHYNSPKFLDTKQFPKAKLIGKIVNLSNVNFEKDGTYEVQFKGTLDMHGKTNPVRETATITVKGPKYLVNSKLNITLSDYDIAFTKGKPSTNIAKTIEVSVEAEYKIANSQSTSTTSATNETPKVIVMVNTAKWCPACKANAKRVEENVLANYMKNEQCHIVVNDLSTEETKNASRHECEKAGITEVAANNPATGVIYFISPATKQVVSQISVTKTNEEIIKAFEQALRTI